VEIINIDTFVKSKQIQFIYTIINSEMDSWNVIGKHWLFCFLDFQFLSSSSLLNIVWFSTEVLLFLSHISFILNILFLKNDDLAQSDFWINKCTHKTRIKIYIYYLWLEIDTSTCGILVVDGRVVMSVTISTYKCV
jgi:hypothetical protein